MFTLDRDKADALCTVIALGFLTISKEDFVIELDSMDEHEKLNLLFGKFKLAHFFPEVRAQLQKRKHPFIYAFPRRDGIDESLQKIFDELLRTGIDRYLQRTVEELERTINTLRIPFRGAYIGGVMTTIPADQTSMVSLLCPSLLYQYETPTYILADQTYKRTTKNDYKSFLETSELLLDIFAMLSEKQSDVYEIAYPLSKSKMKSLVKSMPTALDEDKTLASVHGLITSMTSYPLDNTHFDIKKMNYNVELALSSGTNKVASCIPCAVFASSQGKPASLAHFGRGDYWNLPQNCDPKLRTTWELYVIKCFVEGYKLLRDSLLPQWNEEFFDPLNQFAKALRKDFGTASKLYDLFLKFGNPKLCSEDEHRGFLARMASHNAHISNIPKVFLSALTFPGSFSGRMIKTLEYCKHYKEQSEK